jgi:single-strand DNA-binding protein
MTTSVTGKLNEDASEFQAGESTGFGIRLGVHYQDRETKVKEWTNYEAAIFAKHPEQINYLRSNLKKDSVIEVNCEKLKIKTFDGQNGQRLSLEMINASLGYSFNPNYQAGQQPVTQPQQGGFAPQTGGFAPSQTGYFMRNGQACNPQVVQAMQQAGIQPWNTGDLPPQAVQNIHGWA